MSQKLGDVLAVLIVVAQVIGALAVIAAVISLAMLVIG